MKVKYILADKGTHVHSIHPDKTVQEALAVLNEKHIGALIVLDDEQNIEGIISERDILYRVADVGCAPTQEMLVKDLMTPKEKLIIGHASDDLAYVMSIMTENKIRHLPIISETGKLEGIVSIGDVVKRLLKYTEREKKMLLEYIELGY
jgi:CBS domain-containing protein